MGTGAFSNVEAERDISVTVANDASAYLGIQPGDGPNGNYADTTSNDALAISLTDDNNNIGSGVAGGEGINTNAVTSIGDIFKIQNQGTQEVDVAVTPLAYGDIDGQVFPPDIDGALAVLLEPQNPDEIEVDIEWGVIWPGIPVPEDVSFIGIKGLSPGDELRFNLVALAVPSSAIGSVEVSDEIQITARQP
ncbi:hypothetical protein SAMN05192554_11230 [Haloarchaeobius iranensis]|uniref:Uncharacterized protein n=2 Tax=Haloarchaeobius iranensis TaxID=996166 RepID=A0A1G9XXS6_9EURY|nr:hypothetical protein SAMN05192554_11230 [Haloarchaeobius iranensis]